MNPAKARAVGVLVDDAMRLMRGGGHAVSWTYPQLWTLLDAIAELLIGRHSGGRDSSGKPHFGQSVPRGKDSSHIPQ
jgi:hypothetical protein